MTDPVFSSRDSRYKAPYGAVPCSTEVFFTLRPRATENFSGCTLLLHSEFADLREEIPLAAAGEEGERTLFTGSYRVSAQPELVWYSFRFTRANGESVFLGRNGYCREGQAALWQQTVYDDSLSAPRWFGRGVTYQIFPDRFNRTSVPNPKGMLGDRVVHQGWEEQMEYLPNEKGEILNRDFFGGNLLGIEEKLDYLKELGISTLYLCPIFEADSNHRYNTGDYETIDPMLGTEEDFRRLCAGAKERGIHIMLDGVFNHTGNNSRYFNALGSYTTLGAAQSKDSPYYSWYDFKHWPDRYDAWWGIRTLPAVQEMNPDYIHYIITGENSIIRRWLRAGADAWRLDVADELPDAFIAEIRRVMMEEKADSFLLGEVWEDGSNKIAYNERRKYLLGRETHGLMNYPFRTGAMDFLKGGDAAVFMEAMETIRENYPRDAFYSCMNMLGTHDNPRILTMLGIHPKEAPATRTERAKYRLTDAEYKRGASLLQAGAILLYAFPGSPTVFYGDEAGMQGFEDPFCRGTYPWGKEDAALRRRFIRLGSLRNNRPSLQDGDLRWLYAQGHALAFARTLGSETTIAAVNAGDEPVRLSFDWQGSLATDALTGQKFLPLNGKITICVPPLEGVLLV